MPAPLSRADFPGLDPAEAGLAPNLGYGKVGSVRAHLILGGATALITADVTVDQGSITVEDASRFPVAPFTVQIGYERMRVTDVTAGTLTVTRAYAGTTARAHRKNQTLYEVLTEYVYLVSPEPVRAMDAVYINGHRQAVGFTAYTGQAGDEHADWPGMAVVSFAAEAWIGPQRVLATDEAVARETGEQVEAGISWATHSPLADGSSSSFVSLSPAGVQMARAAFGPGSGVIRKQTYKADVENTGESAVTLKAVISDTATGEVSIMRLATVPASTRAGFAVSTLGGEWETHFSILPVDGGMRVYSMGKTVTRLATPLESEAAASIDIRPVYVSGHPIDDGLSSGLSLSPSARQCALAAYGSEEGGELLSQTHSALVENTGAGEARVVLVSADPSGKGHARTRHTISAGSTEAIAHTHTGGSWDTMTAVMIERGQVDVREAGKSVSYTTEDTLSERSLAHTASAHAVLGGQVSIDAEWAMDDSGGTYTGTPFALIERPDHVIHHFLIERMGFAQADIDTASFEAAGTSYASAISGGYRFGLVLPDSAAPSSTLRRLAFECRSTVRFAGGIWKLSFTPSSAPAALKTITRDALAGEGSDFVFSQSPPEELGNSLTARYRKAYSSNDRGFEAVASSSDSASMAKYGTYKKEFEFQAVRLDAMAVDVLAQVLRERKAPLLTVTFPVFWEHFDVEPGDTITIDNPLYGGSKFFIENMERTDPFRATVTARGWWE